MLEAKELSATLDLWACMWGLDEQRRFEGAVVRALGAEHPRRRRLGALWICLVLATPRLLLAARRALRERLPALEELDLLVRSAERERLRRAEAARLRRNLRAVEELLAQVIAEPGVKGPRALLARIDVRDLVAVARTTLDARVYAEAERWVACRGKYQRGRVAHLLGFPAPRVAEPRLGTMGRGPAGGKGSSGPDEKAAGR